MPIKITLLIVDPLLDAEKCNFATYVEHDTNTID